jgi:sugar-specific transcriptional regulator TrmB
LSEPYDLLEHHKLQDVLRDTRKILELITPEERAGVIQEARSKGIEVEVLVARAMGVLVREAELDQMARRDVQKEREKLPKVGW